MENRWKFSTFFQKKKGEKNTWQEWHRNKNAILFFINCFFDLYFVDKNVSTGAGFSDNKILGRFEFSPGSEPFFFFFLSIQFRNKFFFLTFPM